MHYRNGREAKNGDKIVSLEGGKIVACGVLYGAIPGNDYCNGSIRIVEYPIGCGHNIQMNVSACLCDCLHVDDIWDLLKEKGLHQRPKGM